jgi:hypothetical protein
MVGSDIHTAAVAKFDPALAIQLAISRAGGVGMYVEAARQVAGAEQSMAREHLLAQNG